MRKLLILSGKGGTGKTTTAAAFIRFAEAKAFADCDVDAPNLHLVTHTEAEPERADFLGSQKAAIDPAKCVGCGACRQACRFDAIACKNGQLYGEPRTLRKAAARIEDRLPQGRGGRPCATMIGRACAPCTAASASFHSKRSKWAAATPAQAGDRS
jgi:ferredoxin